MSKVINNISNLNTLESDLSAITLSIDNKEQEMTDYVNTKPSGFKNKIINGGFNVWQRGESFTGLSGAWTYTADRWKVYGISDVSKEADGRLYAKSSNTDTDHAISTILEDISKLHGKVITVSVDIEWIQGAYAGITVVGRNADMSWNTSYGITLDSVMSIGERKTISYSFTFWDNSDIEYLDFRVYDNSDSDALEVKIGDVQLEEGSVATPFEQRPYGLELALCQRYYQKFYLQQPSIVMYTANGDIRSSFPLVCKMRKQPVMTIDNSNFHAIWHGDLGAATNEIYPDVTLAAYGSDCFNFNGGVAAPQAIKDAGAVVTGAASAVFTVTADAEL